MMRSSRYLRGRLTIGLFSAVAVLLFQNCGEPFAVYDGLNSSLLGSTGSAGATLIPDTDKYDSNCMTKSEFDACVFQQNPIARTGTSYPNTADNRPTTLAAMANYGVRLTSLSGNGRLENSTISVKSLTTPLATTSTSALKSRPDTANSSLFEQVNVYYWVNRSAEYFDARTGGILPARNRGVKIIVDDTITGYDTATNTIRLNSRAPNGSMAWNGDVAVHLFGIANSMLANPAGWNSSTTTNHATCNAVDRGCCTTAAGCGNAIRFGIGEYFAISMFPDRTRIGEGIVNTGNPQLVAGVARDMTQMQSMTGAQVFGASSGFSSSMGLLYASIWWEVRKQAGNQSFEIDRLFLEHLSLVGMNDTFRTAFEKVRTVDARLFGGRHIGKFESQLTARGL